MVAILFFFPATQNDLLLSDLIMKTTPYSRVTSPLITHFTGHKMKAFRVDYRGITSIFYCGVAKSEFRFYPKPT